MCENHEIVGEMWIIPELTMIAQPQGDSIVGFGNEIDFLTD